jgi:protein-S-isoprenylcysteine O-methyltransferase Ste14
MTSDMNAQVIVDWMWLTLGVYWLVTALKTKKTEVGEISSLRVLRLLILALIILLLLTHWLRIGPLAWRFVPRSVEIVWGGVVLTGFGVMLAIWARWHLGQNWSDKVVLKVDHELIRSGPYAYLRHPIYSGVLLAVIGTALAVGEWRGILAFILLGSNYYVKATREEKILAGKFGEEFQEHRRRTSFFLPGL